MNLIFPAALASLLSLTSTTLAQEDQKLGRMWTFENPPLAYFEEEYGFKPDQDWLDSLRLGSLRLGGEEVLPGSGSASFVSPEGLIMTSTRCVRAAIASTLDADGPTRAGDPPSILKTGFVATSLEQEIRLRSRRREHAWLTAAQLVKISNVADAVNEGLAPSDDEAQITAKREANKKAILDAARKADPELVPQIVTLYQGAVVQLYQYMVYDDVRLVVLPHLQTAHFGGDPDNFTYPRYRLDFAFLRGYEDGRPADTRKHYFKWKSGGAQEDELVFVSGNPGTTSRLHTTVQLEFERDIRIPMALEWLTNRLRIWGEYSTSTSWQFILPLILELESGQKTARGSLQGLDDEQLIAQKTATEKAFRERVMADEELAEKYGDLWDRIANVVEERRQHEARARFHTAGGMLDRAVSIVRACDPAETAEYRKHAMKAWEGLGNGGYPNAQASAFFVDHVARARNWLPADDPFFSKVLGGRSGGEFLEAMHAVRDDGESRTLVYYAERRNALLKSGWKGIQDCDDPAIDAARELVILMRENKRLGDELDAKEEALGAELGRALLACYGTNVSSDATNTLRFTDGVVRGFTTDGTMAPYRTTFSGLYARNAELADEHPFGLPQVWLDRKDEIDMTKSVNFVSTNDITAVRKVFRTSPSGGHYLQDLGGNSGSVVVNTDLEVVGMVSAGNIESLHNDFVFRGDASRAVSTHVDGVMEALVKIYDAHRIAEELIGK